MIPLVGLPFGGPRADPPAVRARLDGTFSERVFLVSLLSKVVLAAVLVHLGDQIGVGRGARVELVVADPDRLRDVGAGAIAVNGVRLIASSAFVTCRSRLLGTAARSTCRTGSPRSGLRRGRPRPWRSPWRRRHARVGAPRGGDDADQGPNLRRRRARAPSCSDTAGSHASAAQRGVASGRRGRAADRSHHANHPICPP